MSDRILNCSRLRVLGGRPALLCLFILTAAMILIPIIAIGGGGNEAPRLTIQLPRGLAVKSSLHGKRQLQGNLPAGGRYVWSVVGGKGVVRLKTPALDSSIPEGTVKIEGVKPGRVDLRVEYRRLKSGQAGRNGEECAPYEFFCAKNGGKWLINSLLLDAVSGPQEERNDITLIVPSA